MPGSKSKKSPVTRRGSLRAELLFNLSFLAIAALLLAFWTITVLRLPGLSGPRYQWFLFALLFIDVLVFVLLGRYLVDRLVVHPLSDAVAAAEAIADGDYARRAVRGETRETAALADALNRLTEQLLENQERLAQNVRSLDETNRVLLTTQRELVQAEKMASIGRLAAGVAHEIGNPLGAIVGYASVLARRGGEPEIIGGIERESRRIDRIVRRLLDYGRPAPSEREMVDVNASITRVVEMLREQGKLRDVEVAFQLEPGLMPIRASSHDLDQVFVNLFDNADAAMNGRGTLTIKTVVETYSPNKPVPTRRADDPPGITYAHLRRPRYHAGRDGVPIEPETEVLRIVVSDTGPGIPAASIDSVFDPFFTTRPVGEGTGLGLAIVASTMADFGGRIEVSSAEGAGAVFTLSFPTDPTEP